MRKSICISVIILISSSWSYALDIASLEKAFIFNIPSILLEIDEYGGGLGMKAGREKMFLRAGLEFSAEDDGNEPDTLAWGLGAAFEWHFISGRVSPYTGFAAGIHGIHETTTISGGDWTRDDLISVKAGPILGVEFRIIEEVSIFAEYQLRGVYGWPRVTTSVDGDTSTVEEDMKWSWNIAVGNSGKMGICIYF